ncbi:hypothetical protein IL306_013156 [Fusarium sp. DS 682]|nr:hypothetical protein IL306_013156 [Fusarium sp. DS 682]
MSTPAHIQTLTLERFLDAWKSWNAADMLATFSDDFTQTTLPFRLGVPLRSREEVDMIFPVLVGLVSNYKVRTARPERYGLKLTLLRLIQLTVHRTLVDTANSKAAVYASSSGDTPFGPWTMEYAAFLTFNEAGDRIVHLDEMLDSAFMKEFAPKFKEYLKDRKGK